MESDRQAVTVTGGSVDFKLVPPSDARREILITGHMDLVNRYAIGKDWWGHPQFACVPAYLGLDYWPSGEEFDARREASRHQTVGKGFAVDDWGSAELQCELEIPNDRSIAVTYRARLKKGDDDPWQATGGVIVPPKQATSDPPVHRVIDLVRSEMAWPVRAHIEFKVDNDQAP